MQRIVLILIAPVIKDFKKIFAINVTRVNYFFGFLPDVKSQAIHNHATFSHLSLRIRLSTKMQIKHAANKRTKDIFAYPMIFPVYTLIRLMLLH